jgi:hypothetical protein
VAASVAHFVSFEVGNLVNALSRLRFVTTVWHWAVIAMLRMEAVVYVAVKIPGSMKPRASTNEDAARKPLWAVVAIRSAVVRWDVIITVGANRRDSDANVHLSLCVRSGYGQPDSSNRDQRKKLKSIHSSILTIFETIIPFLARIR